MQKSTDERLADIESGITRLTQMQSYLFNVLLILQKKSLLRERSERAMTLIKTCLEPIHRGVDHAWVLIFGTIAVCGIAVSVYSIYYATQLLVFKVSYIVIGVFALVIIIRAFLETRRMSSQLREAKEIFTQTFEDLESAKKEEASVEDDLEQALTEWKGLVPDHLVNEPKSED